MKKARLTTHEEMEADKIKQDISLTATERLLVALRLMKAAIALSPNKLLPSKEDGIEWIELKSSHGKS